VPHVRGRERSRALLDVVKDVENAVAEGYKEITLLGQNVDSYGSDLKNGECFADLLAAIDNIPGRFRVRFMTSHPKDISQRVIDVMANSTHICHNIHLPVQAGSSKVLHDMNRHYDREKYLDIVRRLRAAMPDVGITSDIMVGFPTETEDDFEDTLSLVEEVRYSNAFTFVYSPRKGTPAAELEQIPDSIKSERFSRLLALQNEISLAKNKPMENKTVRGLCDGRSKNNKEVFSGRTEGNKIVFFEADESCTGKFLDIFIERADTFALWGKIIK
jgi:tRNA-2-methylthio-N6-dimethylallyladenosine synthase